MVARQRLYRHTCRNYQDRRPATAHDTRTRAQLKDRPARLANANHGAKHPIYVRRNTHNTKRNVYDDHHIYT